jgi:hypothetical protein
MGKVSADRKGANESREIGGFESTAFNYSCVVGKQGMIQFMVDGQW